MAVALLPVNAVMSKGEDSEEEAYARRATAARSSQAACLLSSRFILGKGSWAPGCSVLCMSEKEERGEERGSSHTHTGFIPG